MELTITQAHNVLQRLGYKGSRRTVLRTIQQHGMGRRMGTSYQRNPWVINLRELRQIPILKGGWIFSEEQWRIAVALVMGEEDATDEISDS